MNTTEEQLSAAHSRLVVTDVTFRLDGQVDIAQPTAGDFFQDGGRADVRTEMRWFHLPVNDVCYKTR